MKYPHLGFDPESFGSLYNVERSSRELEKFLLFAVCVAGKGSAQTAKGLDKLISLCVNQHLYFGIISCIASMDRQAAIELFRGCGLGCMTQRLNFCLSYHDWWFDHDLKEASLNDLLKLKGIGQKTARFFLLYNFPFQPYVAVDTHILKVLRDLYPEAPKVTPSNPTEYRKWELQFLSDYSALILGSDDLPLGVHGDHYAKMDFKGWTKGRQMV